MVVSHHPGLDVYFDDITYYDSLQARFIDGIVHLIASTKTIIPQQRRSLNTNINHNIHIPQINTTDYSVVEIFVGNS